MHVENKNLFSQFQKVKVIYDAIQNFVKSIHFGKFEKKLNQE